jgi:hypothetical protein
MKRPRETVSQRPPTAAVRLPALSNSSPVNGQGELRNLSRFSSSDPNKFASQSGGLSDGGSAAENGTGEPGR